MCGATTERSLSGFDWTLFRTQKLHFTCEDVAILLVHGLNFFPPPTLTLDIHTLTPVHEYIWSNPLVYFLMRSICASVSPIILESLKEKQRLSWSHHWFCRIRAAVSADCTVSKVASRRNTGVPSWNVVSTISLCLGPKWYCWTVIFFLRNGWCYIHTIRNIEFGDDSNPVEPI